jgi:hypothetical protein
MKNLEIKTKRMSLANIEGKLSLTEMETIMAGSGRCMLLGGMTVIAGFFGPYAMFAAAMYTVAECG